MPMKIDERLNLVIPVYDEKGEICAHVFSSPVSRAVFETHFRLLAKTFSAIHGEGYGSVAGPRVAMLILKDIAKQLTPDETSAAAMAAPLIREIIRLTNVLVLKDGAWEMLPYETTRNSPLLSEEDTAEVDNAIVFFIVLSAMHRREALREPLQWATRMWGARLSSSSITEYIASLPTLTQAAISSALMPPLPKAVPEPDAGPAEVARQRPQPSASVVAQGGQASSLPI